MKSLYRQFVQTSGWFLILSVIIGLMITNIFYLTFTKQQTTEQNLTRAQEVTSILETMHGDAEALTPFLDSVANLGYQIVLADSEGSLQSFGKPFEEIALSQEAQRVVSDGTTYTGEDGALSFFMTSHFANRITNTVGVPFEVDGEAYGLFLRPDLSLLSSDIHTLLLAFLLSIALVNLLGMLWMAKQLTKPIGLLRQATQEVANDNYSHSLGIERQDEIGELAESFNKMIERLRENDTARKTFITNVSHDLQSPLVNIRGYAELIENEADASAPSHQHAKVIQQEATRLSGLAKQLLLLSTLDQPTYQLTQGLVEVDKQLKQIVSSYRYRFEEKQLEVTLKLEPVTIQADAELLEVVWDNLLSNATKYTQEGGRIAVIMKADASAVTICIEDSGEGIAEQDLPHITERFYRADLSRHTEGTGLGLAIVNEIVTLHKGTLQIESTLHKGTRVVVTLPIL